MHAGSIRAAAAVSTRADSARAALDVARQVSRRFPVGDPHWCVAFATDHHREAMPRLLDTLSSALGTPYVVGGSSAGVLSPETDVDEGPALGVLAVRSDAVRATPFVFPGGADRGRDAGAEIGRRLIRSRRGDDLICLWSDPLRCRADRLLEGLGGVLGDVPVAGGVSSLQSGGSNTFQFSGAECLAGAVAGIRLGGSFRRRIEFAHGFRALGAPLRVTGSHGELLLELDGRPAHRALFERIPDISHPEERHSRRGVLVGILPRGGESADPARMAIRNVLEVDPDAGVLEVDGPIEEGRRVLFGVRDPGAALDDLRDRLSGLRPGDYRFGLYFHCVARGRPRHDGSRSEGAVIAAALPGMPFLGCLCNAEIGPSDGANRVFTSSGILVLVGES